MKTTDYAGRPITLIVPPNVEGMITGTKYAKIFPSGVVQLTYRDDTTESANLTPEQLAAGRQHYFNLVSAVQSYR